MNENVERSYSSIYCLETFVYTTLVNVLHLFHSLCFSLNINYIISFHVPMDYVILSDYIVLRYH